jgi:hypothetical protein
LELPGVVDGRVRETEISKEAIVMNNMSEVE